MKIAVLGASVSAQVSSDGEITGYVEFFRREILEKSREVEVKQFCYPGNRLSDAGIVMVSQIVDYMPDVCIVEPIVEDISRGVNSSNFDILYVYDKLINAGILPITLILPWPENNKELPAYRIIKEIHHKYPIRLIEFDLPDGFSRDDYFSGPHTKKAEGYFTPLK
jgi:hypothetical protein